MYQHLSGHGCTQSDLHGSGGTAARQAATSGFETLAAREGVLVATLQAQAEGNLKTTPEQVVTVEAAGPTQTIIIQPADPEVVYVPAYNPTVVYGTWAYPS